MVHWGFLILAFIAGFASCYGMIYQLAKLYGQAMGVVEEAAKGASL